MNPENQFYRVYSDALKERFGEKVYKLPVNLPLTCPNRDGTKGRGGCIFCGEDGAGHETRLPGASVRKQLTETMAYIGKRYGAKKFIAYFQNYTNTYVSMATFKEMVEATAMEHVVAISLSTRPDCISEEQLDYLEEFQYRTGRLVYIEMGLQSANEDTLLALNRGHTVVDFIGAAERIKSRGFILCAHMILDLPWDQDEDILAGAMLLNRLKVDEVKFHSLYVVKGTELERMMDAGEVTLLKMDTYIERVIMFLRALDSKIVIQRIIGRAPKENVRVCNWNTSWWKIKDEIIKRMASRDACQGDRKGMES
ncbi:TIGR01212 family radical SAM protein [Gottschalkiaceae bacterium SANA]|nr:TIGR01212 family radical SAM protein [Gottschalkiaceae bacterium SANA]